MIQDLLNKFIKTKTSKFINEELVYKFYEQVSKDIQSGIKEEGVWAKAFTFAEGDEQKTKAKYIEFMVERLMLAHEAENELLEKNVKESYEKQKKVQKLEEKIKFEEENKEWEEFTGSFVGQFFLYLSVVVSGFLTFIASEVFNTNILILFITFFAACAICGLVLYIFWVIFKTEPKKGPRNKPRNKKPIHPDMPSENNPQFKDFLAKKNISYLECKHKWGYWKGVYAKWQQNKH